MTASTPEVVETGGRLHPAKEMACRFTPFLPLLCLLAPLALTAVGSFLVSSHRFGIDDA